MLTHQVKTHTRKRKNGASVVKKHSRKSGAKVKDGTHTMSQKYSTLADMVGKDAKCEKCGKKGCKCKKEMVMKTKYSRKITPAKKSSTTVVTKHFKTPADRMAHVRSFIGKKK